MFSFTTKYFETAYINSTFCRYPTKRMIHDLYGFSSKNFKLLVKFPTFILLKKKLRLEKKVENNLLRSLEFLNSLNSSNKLDVKKFFDEMDLTNRNHSISMTSFTLMFNVSSSLYSLPKTLNFEFFFMRLLGPL